MLFESLYAAPCGTRSQGNAFAAFLFHSESHREDNYKALRAHHEMLMWCFVVKTREPNI
jgi:hypothetical protein